MPSRPQPEPTDVDFTVVADPWALPGPPPVVPWWERAYRWMDQTGNAMAGPTRDRRARDRRFIWIILAVNPGIPFLAVMIVSLLGWNHHR